jgi:hypothetical protein
MQEWSSLQLELLKHGYRKIECWQFGCPDHGTFRIATEIPIEAYACPRCHRLYETSFVLEGFTRRRLPIVELIEPPLTKRTRFALLRTRRVRRQTPSATRQFLNDNRCLRQVGIPKRSIGTGRRSNGELSGAMRHWNNPHNQAHNPFPNQEA